MSEAIVGAGLAGLITACIFPDIPIYEAMQAPSEIHKALLRFRGDEVAKVTGIPFKRVNVRKGIFSRGEFREPSIDLCNLYSIKVVGRVLNRSIWSTEPVDRFIAPEDFYQRLVERHARRIEWDCEFDFQGSRPIINTAPLPIVLGSVNKLPDISFNRSPIKVVRYRVECAKDIYQTVYFPTSETNVYRASITNDLMIVEMAPDFPSQFGGGEFCDPDMEYITRAFGLTEEDVRRIGAVEQRYGKIEDIDRNLRKALLYDLTKSHKIYSVGRFACWRNILLDDVVKDLDVVKSLMNSDEYSAKLLSF